MGKMGKFPVIYSDVLSVLYVLPARIAFVNVVRKIALRPHGLHWAK